MAFRYSVHPSVGIARVGSAEKFYLAPVTAGGLPIECDDDGTMQRLPDGEPVFVRQFKIEGKVRPQGARFTVYRFDDEAGTAEELTVHSADVESITWTVHVANKKACWFVFTERLGDTTISPNNSYAAKNVPPRNKDAADRRALVIDPGPRTLSGAGGHTTFSAADAGTYAHAHFPPNVAIGTRVTSLGEMRTDRDGRLVVIGGPGVGGGDKRLTGAQEDTWYDDVGDGPVTCTVKLHGEPELVLRAWCITAPPKFAPELVNTVTLDDLMLDAAVKKFGLLPGRDDAYPDTLVASFERDIAPLVERLSHLTWVAYISSAAVAARPTFDLRDASESNRQNRERYAARFRRDESVFFDPNGVPLLPVQPGYDVAGDDHSSFLTLTGTQLRMLRQWARGRFTTAAPEPFAGVHALDRASAANCVGGPLDPGFEVSWSLMNPALYEAPWRIRHRHADAPEYYANHGLDPDEDETDGRGCEPGDLTKRLNVPWHADLCLCNPVRVTLNDPSLGHPHPPPFFESFWWPVQRPGKVIHGLRAHNHDDENAGIDVEWDRSLGDMDPERWVKQWMTLGFVMNQNRADGRDYPYFVEVEHSVPPLLLTDAIQAVLDTTDQPAAIPPIP